MNQDFQALIHALGAVNDNPLQIAFSDIITSGTNNDGDGDGDGAGTAANIDIFANVTNLNPVPPLESTCPGISTPRDRVKSWKVCRDGRANETYCSSCVDKFKLTNTVTVQGTGGYCHGYIKGCAADNEVFNVSFWGNDKRKYYPTEVLDGDNDSYLVEVPHGAQINILVTFLNPKEGQYFRCSVVQTIDDVEHVIIPEERTYCHRTCLLRTRCMHNPLFYIDSPVNLKHIPNTFGPGSNLSVKINLYDIKTRIYNGSTGRNLGVYKWDTTKGMIPITTGINKTAFPRSVIEFNDRYTKHMPTDRFEKFTQNPLVMNFVLMTDNASNSNDSWARARMVLERAIIALKKSKMEGDSKARKARDDLEKRKVILEQLNQKLNEVDTRITELQSIMKENELLKPTIDESNTDAESSERDGDGDGDGDQDSISEISVD